MTKKFRLIYTDKRIINSDYLDEQEGTTYPADGTQTFECDTLEEMEAFVSDNELSYTDPQDIEAEKAELEQAKAEKIAKLEMYDTSNAVNSFSFGGQWAWFAADIRAQLNTSLESAALLGETNITFAINGRALELPLAQAKMMLASIHRYADACYLVTAQHKANIFGLNTKTEVEDYDFTQSYPVKLEF